MSAALKSDQLHDMVEAMADLHEQKQKLNKQIKDIEKEYTPLEQKVLQIMQDLQLDTIKSGGIALAITEQKFASVAKDEHGEPAWNRVFQWIAETDNWHLMRKQLNITSCVELANLEELPPFIGIATTRKLSNPKR